MFSQKISTYVLVLPIALAFGHLSIASEKSPFGNVGSADGNITDAFDGNAVELTSDNVSEASDTMKALFGLKVLSQVSAGELASIAAKMGVAENSMNALYVTAKATSELYDRKSAKGFANWCKSFNAKKINGVVEAGKITALQNSLAALDTAVMNSVQANIDNLARKNAEAYAVVMETAQSFNVQSSSSSNIDVDPGVWLENHKQACLVFGS